MVLTEERCRRTAPRVHGWPPHPKSQLWVRCGSNRHSQAATPIGGRSWIVAKRTDRSTNSVDLFQPRGPTTSSMRSYRVDASRAKLSRLPLLCGVGQYGDQHSGTRGSCFWGRPKFWPRPGPPEGEGPSFSCLCQCPFLNVNTPVQGLGCAHSTPRGVSLLEDVTRWEAHCVCSERLRARM
jgi:hypothetical protein